MVALAVSHKKTLEPKFIDRGVKINGIAFLDLLENHYAPNMAIAYGGMKRFWYCHDNAPAHTARPVKDYVAQHLKAFEWPASSPDLNPLDYVNIAILLYYYISPKQMDGFFRSKIWCGFFWYKKNCHVIILFYNTGG